MKKVISGLALFAALLALSAHQLWKQVPVPVGNSVIAEKATKEIGNQVVAVLPSDLSAKQHRLLNMAYRIGQEEDFKSPEIMQAILLQETQAGGMARYKVANPGPEAYFGPMQIKLAAARDVLNRWPSLYNEFNFHTKTDDEIKANLILNEEFNLTVAAKYLLILKRTYGLSGRELINAYNRGPGGVKSVDNDYHYAVGAEQKLAAWKKR